ncbi:MAG: methyltransferase domain-containing protein [Candidatus Aegiribacteria sp.]|nr:methyltransferase domain-containing protein [Candidatus Aegiribacteria sp.]
MVFQFSAPEWLFLSPVSSMSWNSMKTAEKERVGSKELLERNSIPFEGRILDFGCGCGRVLRFWKGLPETEIYGTDYNRILIRWCKQNLDFVKVSVNGYNPPTGFSDDFFNIVYAISVFTHLSEEMQAPWLKELVRITAPGGHIILTVHGSARTEVLVPEQKKRFRNGELVVRGGSYSGSNVCGVYHPRDYLQKICDGTLEEVDYVEMGASDADQDVYLFRKL